MGVTTKGRRRGAGGDRSAPRGAASDAASVRGAVEAILDRVGAASAQTERDRHVPAELVAALKESGTLRLLLPRAHGGIGADLPAALEVFELLATADASTAWVAALGATSWTDLVGLPRRTFDAIWERDENALVALVFAPGGSSVASGSAYEVSGRWAFASGCRHADWLAGSTIDEEGRMRLVLFDPAQVTVEDTWHVAGLRGSGSHHFTADKVLVPAERTLEVFVDPPCIDGPAGRMHPTALFASVIASVALGAAQGALDDVAGLSATKTPLLSSGVLRRSPTFQRMVAEADTTIRACRAVLRECARLTWDVAAEGREPGDVERARMRAGTAWVVEQCAAVVTAAYRHGGGGALYDDSPLQRRLRDVNAITQHFLVRPDTATHAGALLLGEEIDLPVF